MFTCSISGPDLLGTFVDWSDLTEKIIFWSKRIAGLEQEKDEIGITWYTDTTHWDGIEALYFAPAARSDGLGIEPVSKGLHLESEPFHFWDGVQHLPAYIATQPDSDLTIQDYSSPAWSWWDSPFLGFAAQVCTLTLADREGIIDNQLERARKMLAAFQDAQAVLRTKVLSIHVPQGIAVIQACFFMIHGSHPPDNASAPPAWVRFGEVTPAAIFA